MQLYDSLNEDERKRALEACKQADMHACLSKYPLACAAGLLLVISFAVIFAIMRAS